MKNTKYLLPKDGVFYKANLHCHSNVSDGQLTPLQLKESYRSHGYQILAYTDHRLCIDHSYLNDEDFLALTGVELDNRSNTSESAWEKAYHLCCISRKPVTCNTMIQLGSYGLKSVKKTIKNLNESGFIVHYNHPVWSSQTAADFCHLDGVMGFEVYNHSAQTYGMEGNALSEYAIFLKSGSRAYPIAADDNHNFGRDRRLVGDSFGGYTMIKASSLDYDSIISALDAGHLYASTGPEINEFTLTDKTLHIKCSPVCKALLKTTRIGSNPQNVIVPDDSITEVSFDISNAGGFARIEICAKNDTFACTAPVYSHEWNG